MIIQWNFDVLLAQTYSVLLKEVHVCTCALLCAYYFSNSVNKRMNMGMHLPIAKVSPYSMI